MSTLASLTNHQIRLARRPNGMAVRADWDYTTEPVVEPQDVDIALTP